MKKLIKVSMIAGIVSGFVGVGGGVILTPVWLSMGYQAS